MDIVLNGHVSSQITELYKYYNREPEVDFEIRCYTNRNIKVVKLYFLAIQSKNSDYTSQVKVTVKQNNTVLYNHDNYVTPLRNEGMANTSAILIENALIHKGYFEVNLQVNFVQRNNPLTYMYEQLQFSSSSHWEHQDDGYVKWRFQSSGIPLHGFRYQIVSNHEE